MSSLQLNKINMKAKLNLPGTDLKISVTKPDIIKESVQEDVLKITSEPLKHDKSAAAYTQTETLREVSTHERIPCNWTVTSLVDDTVCAYSDSGNTFKGKKEDFQALFK